MVDQEEKQGFSRAGGNYGRTGSFKTKYWWGRGRRRVKQKGLSGEPEICLQRPCYGRRQGRLPVCILSLVTWFLGKNGSARENTFGTDSINEI